MLGMLKLHMSNKTNHLKKIDGKKDDKSLLPTKKSSPRRQISGDITPIKSRERQLCHSYGTERPKRPKRSKKEI